MRSALADKPLPDFTLPALLPGKPGVARTGYGGGQPRLLNVFASWCMPCKAEAPQLMKLKAMGVPIDAVATNDTPRGDARRSWRAMAIRMQRIGDDRQSKVQIALGSSGVPETFLIDGARADRAAACRRYPRR